MSEGFTTEGRAFIPRSTYRNLHATPGDVEIIELFDGETPTTVEHPAGLIEVVCYTCTTDEEIEEIKK